MREEDKLLTTIRGYLGISGRPNPITLWYASRHGSGFRTAAWCGMTVSKAGFDAGLTQKVGEFAYTPDHAKWFQRQGKWGRKPKKGAIIFFNWRGSNSRPWPTPEHVGIVQSVLPNGNVVCIEGNTSNAVHRRNRNPKFIVGYGYPDFAGDGTPPPPPVPDGGKLPYPGFLIRPGDTGPAVRVLKDRLIILGFTEVKAGANYKAHAVTAVRQFQTQQGLTSDGVVGPATWKALFG